MQSQAIFSNAYWIWAADQNPSAYNISAHFRKTFISEGHVSEAVLHITADSRYRVAINQQWINDGPGRAYPEHWTYDSYNIKPFLKSGINIIEVTARYYGVGTFHQLPQQAGLLAEIHLDHHIIGSDKTWEATINKALLQNTPKVSIQMEPAEIVEGNLREDLHWRPSAELYKFNQGPWKDLSPRCSEPLTKIACRPVRVHGVHSLLHAQSQVCVPVTRLAYPGLIEANHSTSRPVVLSAILDLSTRKKIHWEQGPWRVALQGKLISEDKIVNVGKSHSIDEATFYEAGRYAVMFFCNDFFSHHKELHFPYLSIPGTQWTEWQVFVLEEFIYIDNDRFWLWFKNEKKDQLKNKWNDAVQHMAQQWASLEQARPQFGKRLNMAHDVLFLPDFAQDFALRKPLRINRSEFNPNASALCEGQQGLVSVEPHGHFDIELCYDFGEQRCGYIDFSLESSEGVVLDFNMVEYINSNGTLQHTVEYNRNGLRYICKNGLNRYTSLKRRSGRFLFVTLRNLVAPANLQSLQIIESTAKVQPQLRFYCSDQHLNSIWDICERTLKMCMEDVFTDCPLYEQTLWIGDARNEALYAFNVYGNYSISQRSLELGAQSLEQFPIVGCQVPSAWDCILPAWSFLWGIQAWEHYFYTGDKDFLIKLWPAIQKNCDGALNYINREGLFSAPFWSLLEWAPIDHEHDTVIHNSILLAGALGAAEKCAKVLNEESAFARFEQRRLQLMVDINKTWSDKKNSYPDAILKNGEASAKVCQHNSALAVMCRVLEAKNTPAAKNNLLCPKEDMTLIASPFAAQFHYEALEELGEFEAILSSIRQNYIPMIEAGATTVWETFPGSTCAPKGFPTRSHCHGWSCSPLQFFNRIILGIRQIAIGGKVFEISPWVDGLEHASGSMGTPHGLVRVNWCKQGQELTLNVEVPQGVIANFVNNKSCQSHNVIWKMNEH